MYCVYIKKFVCLIKHARHAKATVCDYTMSTLMWDLGVSGLFTCHSFFFSLKRDQFPMCILERSCGHFWDFISLMTFLSHPVGERTLLVSRFVLLHSERPLHNGQVCSNYKSFQVLPCTLHF